MRHKFLEPIGSPIGLGESQKHKLLSEYTRLISQWRLPERLPVPVIEVLVESYLLLPEYAPYKKLLARGQNYTILAYATDMCATEIERVFKKHGLHIQNVVTQYQAERPQRIRTFIGTMKLPKSATYFERLSALSNPELQFACTGRMRDHVSQSAVIKRGEEKQISSNERLDWLDILENETVTNLLPKLLDETINSEQFRDVLCELACRHAVAKTGRSPFAMLRDGYKP